MKFTVLGSGSTGNAVLIHTEKTKILVDAGMSAKQIVARLAAVGVDCGELNGILITHEHGDHANGLRVLLNSVRCPVFMSAETEYAYINNPKTKCNESQKRADSIKDKNVKIESSRDFRIGDIDFEPFSVPHDAVDNFGFIARNANVKIATIMDFGYFTTLIKEKLKNCDGIIIESNHSRDMLKTSPLYSWELKQRILSNTGHLSNEDLSDWLTTEFDGAAQHIVLAHLSQQANEPHLARLTAQTALQMRSPLFKVETQITISYHGQPTDWIEF